MKLITFLVGAASIAAASVLPAGAAIALLGPVTTGTGAGGLGNKTIATGYDASGADKLVVVIGGEHGFAGNTGGIFNSMTYGGTPMTMAVQQESGIATAAIFFLDDPGAAGNIVVNQANHNSSPYAIFRLTGTLPGYGSTERDVDRDVTISAAADSWVVVGIDNAGPAGGNFPAALSAVSPLTEIANRVGNTRWNTLDVAIATGSGTYTFSGAAATDVLGIVAVEFTAFTAVAIPEPASFALLGPIGFLLLRRRR